MDTYVWGCDLLSALQREVLARYVYRYTGDHKPGWARILRPNGEPYAMQFSSDADWLAHTRFAVTSAGRLNEREHYCESYPTWPRNPELRKASLQ